MAETRGVWGIDIGLAGLKAIRLVYAEGAKQVLATAFDYVPHPKILSQPDANPDELIAEALNTFLSRNNLQGDGVAIGVPGQTALARFIQLPPVESSKVGEIVKYEAKQQIPFALEEVIWDYQPLGGGIEESGFMLDAEVGLFAMKREQVQQHLAPFLARKVEVDLIQIAPLALYNFLCHDQFGQAPVGQKPGDSDSEQEDYTLLLDMGADNTTLLVSNGKKIWNRNVPLGGNHFTRALTKEMKLTFAKAEHLKCNATKSPDPKAVFQALRPVFNDYVAEIQRSIGFFSSVNRDAKIARIVGVGNGFKLAGLQKFLQQNLQMDVERVDTFQSLAGDAVLNAPLFQENLLSFAVPYGLALQGLKITRVYTSLLPPEIKTARLIRKKKPWAVATAALLMFALTLSTIGYAHVWSAVSAEKFGQAETKANAVVNNKKTMAQAYETAKSKNAASRKELMDLMVAGSQRTPWLAVLKAINECLPRDVTIEEVEQTDPTQQNRIRILSIISKRYDDVGEWYKGLTDDKKKWMRSNKEAYGERAAPDDKETAPKGPGFVFTLQGRHFHSSEDIAMTKVPYVANTLLKNLNEWEVPQLSVVERGPTGVMFPVRKLGIKYATIVDSRPTRDVLYFKNGPAAAGAALTGAGGEGPAAPTPRNSGSAGRGRGNKSNKSNKPASGAPANPEESQAIPLTDFVVEFVWQDVPEDKQEAADPNPIKKPGAAAAPNAAAPNAAAPGQPAPAGPNAAPNAAPGATGAPGVTPPGGNPQTPGGNMPGGTPGAPPAGAPPGGPATGPGGGVAPAPGAKTN
ncbi:MAG TPA: type IV pilus assembly protein PilM [Planctomycetaceae bacterium]